MFHIYIIFESGILVSGMSTVWENTYGCAKKYSWYLSVYLMTVLSSSYGIIVDIEINTPGHGNNVVYGLSATEKKIFEEGNGTH